MYNLRSEPEIHKIYEPNQSIKFEPNYLIIVLRYRLASFFGSKRYFKTVKIKSFKEEAKTVWFLCFFLVLTSNKPVLSTDPCSARVNSKRGGYASKHIAMLYELRKKKN